MLRSQLSGGSKADQKKKNKTYGRNTKIGCKRLEGKDTGSRLSKFVASGQEPKLFQSFEADDEDNKFLHIRCHAYFDENSFRNLLNVVYTYHIIIKIITPDIIVTVTVLKNTLTRF